MLRHEQVQSLLHLHAGEGTEPVAAQLDVVEAIVEAIVGEPAV